MQTVVISYYIAQRWHWSDIALLRVFVSPRLFQICDLRFVFYWVSTLLSSYCWLAFSCPGMDIKLILRLFCKAVFARTDESNNSCLVLFGAFLLG